MLRFMTILFLFLSIFFSCEADEAALQLLSENARKELKIISYPDRDWTIQQKTHHGDDIYDVIIVGAGQTGTGIAVELLKEGVRHFLILDKATAGLEGPWLSFARMESLRTPKEIVGPDGGIPSLTTQCWYEALYGKEHWEALHTIPRVAWAHYLSWVRSTMDLPLKNGCQVRGVEWLPSDHCFLVPVSEDKSPKNYYAKIVVFATGLSGSGSWIVPDLIKNNIPKKYYHQVAEDIPFDLYKGKKVAIVGGGASAFDNAVKLADADAAAVHVLIRRPKINLVDSNDWANFTGFLKHYKDLCDDNKWRVACAIEQIGQTPSSDSLHKAQAKSNVIFEYNSPMIDAFMKRDKAIIVTPKGEQAFDHLFVACGIDTDLSASEELAKIYDSIALWEDKFEPTEDSPFQEMLKSPYLTANHQFTEKRPGTAPYLQWLFDASAASYLSGGFGAMGLLGMKYTVKAITEEITRRLFDLDFEEHYNALLDYEGT